MSLEAMVIVAMMTKMMMTTTTMMPKIIILSIIIIIIIVNVLKIVEYEYTDEVGDDIDLRYDDDDHLDNKDLVSCQD